MIIPNFLISFVLLSMSGKPTDPTTKSTIGATIDRLVDKLKPKLNEDSSSYWIGVAGGPGSGKTTVATKVADRLNEIKEDSALVIPMDGWHTPKDDLIAKLGPDSMKRRGAPWTFDLDVMKIQLQEAKSTQATSSTDLPTYCREISDPVPGGVTLKTHHKIIFVEGLYMLMKEEYPELFELWDERWYIQAPTKEEQIGRLVSRSLKTWSEEKAKMWGEGEAGARARIEANDVKNLDIVETSRPYADELIIND